MSVHVCVCTCTFYMETARQVGSFTLPVHMESPVWKGVSDGSVILIDSGPQLLLSTISSPLLQQFHDHQLSTCHLWVVRTPFSSRGSLLRAGLRAGHSPRVPSKGALYVLTTSMDNDLCLYMWEDQGHHLHLKSCCYLEHRRDDQTPS